MTLSIRVSQWALRSGLAAGFFWLGVSIFINGSTTQLNYLIGVFEVLVGLSFVTGVFMRIFALLASIFLVVSGVSLGLSELIVRDVGLIGGLLALALWPERI